MSVTMKKPEPPGIIELLAKLVGLCAIPLTVIGLLAGCTRIGDALRAVSWPLLPCSVVSSSVVKVPGPRGAVLNQPMVEYRYTWDGFPRTGREGVAESSWGTYSNESDAQEVLSRYPVGSTQHCRTNPSIPSETTLQRCLGQMDGLSVIGALLFTLCFPWLWAAWKTSRTVTLQNKLEFSTRPTARELGPLAVLALIVARCVRRPFNGQSLSRRLGFRGECRSRTRDWTPWAPHPRLGGRPWPVRQFQPRKAAFTTTVRRPLRS